jgi:hypothetical protein
MNAMNIFAWGTLAAFLAVGVLSLALMIRSLREPAQPDVVLYFSAKRNLVFSCFVLLGSVVAIAIGIVKRQYYLLIAAPLLTSYTLPTVVEYFRTREALRKVGRLPNRKQPEHSRRNAP